MATATMSATSLTVSKLSASKFLGDAQPLSKSSKVCMAVPAKAVVISASSQQSNDDAALSRRNALLLAATTAVGVSLAKEEPAYAAYGQSANIFGQRTPNSGYFPITKDGFKIDVPSKWNPSKEQDFDNVALRWEDNFDQGSHLVVMKQTAGGKNSITDYGSPQEFIDKNSYLLGEQVFFGATNSEGGFASGRVLAANVLDASSQKDSNGNSYYKYEILTRTADGTEGGRHILITASAKNGELFVSKVSIGDKRWFKGSERIAREVDKSFSLA